MKKSIIPLLAGSIFAGLLLAPNPAASQEITLRLHTFLPPIANPVKHFMKPWAEKIGKDSKGRLKVQIYPSMQLGGKPTQLLDQVRDGVVDIVWILPGFTPGRMPKIETFELPFVHREVRSTVLALQDFQDKYLKDELKDYKVLLLHATEGYLFMTKKPITKMKDLKGMKLRGASRTGVWALEALGVAAIGTPLPQLPPMLAKGTVDGSLLPYEIAPAVKMHELVNYFTVMSPPQPRFGSVVFTFLMNKNSYNKLPADLKKVINDNSGRNLAPTAAKIWQDIEIKGEAVMHTKKKNKFNTLSPEETAKIKAAVKPVYDRYFAEMKKLGYNGEAMLADARAMIEKYSK